jgi:rare lipoprotein A (peptidoglycan hydrolase)
MRSYWLGYLGIIALLLTLMSCTPSPRYTSAKQPARESPRENPKQEHEGTASYYGAEFHGRRTANGEIYNMYAMTAAHRTLPFNTWILVTNLDNGKQVTVRLNDRGPFVKGRIIDLSYGAAQKIGVIGPGTARVRLEVLELGGR